MNLTRAKQMWNATPFNVRLAVIAGVVGLILLASSGVGYAVHKIGQGAFETGIQKKEAEIQKLVGERDQLVKKAEALEAQQQILEQKDAALEQAIKAQGGKVLQEQKKIDEAINQFKNDSEITNADVPDDVRRARLCAKLQQLQYRCS
jgi:hypothetical protein